MNILIIEDEAVTVMLLKNIIESYGFRVMNAFSRGEDAINFINQGEIPDFIIMDIGLAGEFNGIETISQILNIHAVPFMYLTGYDDESILGKARATGPLEINIKPVRKIEIINILKKINE